MSGRELANVRADDQSGGNVGSVPGDATDITACLPTLQFESTIPDDHRAYLGLRARSHAVAATIAAQAAYFANVLTEARQARVNLQYQAKGRAHRLLLDSMPREPLYIGIIGGGRMGCHIANALLTYGGIRPDEIIISTRRPETLMELQDKGVRCVGDNAEVAACVHLLFLCILPSQLPTVAEEIKSSLSIQSLVYSILAAVPIPRLKQLLGFQFVLRPDYQWDSENMDKPWDFSLDMSGTFARLDMVEHTCPLSFHKTDAVITTDERLASVYIYAMVNILTHLGLTRSQTLGVIHGVVFGLNYDEVGDNLKIREEDLTKQPNPENKSFPIFDLSRVCETETPLSKCLSNKEELRQAFVKKYLSIFEEYQFRMKFHLTQ
ncbi:NADP-dependent oxidoreductase domain-containing protein 1-like [Lineus longissimus]|uniref:NADP-dependent oxidoreductase domain-containing protein 1-like n=1 Tax=Lineus longissimus TaxID=88925 RepID=UPI00315DD212